ncbi:putative RNA binding protein [Polychytrium aggregatum]|uniref:putative RNA binding protein n=1 Tax=Polychytrium aggregatum TaxID=110093 RepID=UPI0022FE4D9B|nr:putative RNA binding protein [Polychytrium aggregatum]KAI9202055.1 putative RNA binding protein [Polychytrium aggregatum]
MSTKLETWGNEESMNMNNILFQNIISSPYFKSLYEKKTYHEVLHEICNHVQSLEPFMRGTVASTAFCLLYKMWTLRLTIKQIEGMINYSGNAHVRAVGFMYLRYVCKPANFMDWFADYLEDDEMVQIQGGVAPRSITIGRLIFMLLTEPKWLGTILPRIPVPIARDIDKYLKDNPPRRSAKDEMDVDRGRDQGPASTRSRSRSPEDRRRRSRSREDRRRRSHSREDRRRGGYRDSSRSRSRSRDRRRRSRSREDRRRRSRSREDRRRRRSYSREDRRRQR